MTNFVFVLPTLLQCQSKCTCPKTFEIHVWFPVPHSFTPSLLLGNEPHDVPFPREKHSTYVVLLSRVVDKRVSLTVDLDSEEVRLPGDHEGRLLKRFPTEQTLRLSGPGETTDSTLLGRFLS